MSQSNSCWVERMEEHVCMTTKELQVSVRTLLPRPVSLLQASSFHALKLGITDWWTCCLTCLLDQCLMRTEPSFAIIWPWRRSYPTMSAHFPFSRVLPFTTTIENEWIIFLLKPIALPRSEFYWRPRILMAKSWDTHNCGTPRSIWLILAIGLHTSTWHFSWKAGPAENFFWFPFPQPPAREDRHQRDHRGQGEVLFSVTRQDLGTLNWACQH